jgi:hypothetical protein
MNRQGKSKDCRRLKSQPRSSPCLNSGAFRSFSGNAHADWGVGAVLGVQTCYLTVIFNAEVNEAAVGIGKAEDGFNQVFVWPASAIAFKLDSEGFLSGNRAIHLTI